MPPSKTIRSPISGVVADDAERSRDLACINIRYEKAEKNKVKVVRDLKPPPAVFSRLLVAATDEWVQRTNAEYSHDLAAFATSLEVDGKGNTKPTAFHFTAAQQEFLKAADESRSNVTREEAYASLVDGRGRKPGKNLRWDPRDERSHALMAQDPDVEGTAVDATQEWLAFRGLVAFPVLSIGRKQPATTSVNGRGEGMVFSWPLWRVAADWPTVTSLIKLPISTLTADRGVIAVATSSIRRTAQGFGNFGPAAVRAV